MNTARKHVASRTLRSVDWNNSTLINGDVANYVSELKKQSGPEIQVHGSGDLLQTLLKNDLIDEFQVWTFPGEDLDHRRRDRDLSARRGDQIRVFRAGGAHRRRVDLLAPFTTPSQVGVTLTPGQRSQT